jgi:hypothetical protein
MFEQGWYAALAAAEAAPLDVEHRHRYGFIPVWNADRTAVESWWWCTDHPAGEWVHIESDPDYLAALRSPDTETAEPFVVCGIGGCDFAVERGEGRTMALHQSEDHPALRRPDSETAGEAG